ncbi:DUF3060 domain-containing protein [Pyxidicoccus trucidator]|uniref:DUF3060 domain-containing protein n=1 Tax=Pyxidicoccus trucidator TaxID=2709662 RepID=UPI0013D93116|nr:DUF3060 domain-containing protein [Pyxidicoccus trucidator]
MHGKLGAAVFMVVACVLGPVTAGAQADDETSIQVGKDGSVKVKGGGSTVETRGGGTRVQSGGATVETRGGSTRVQSGRGTTVVETDDSDDSDDTEAGGDESSLEIVDSGRKVTLQCGKGGEAEITGSSNTVTLKGECKSVEVSGSDNKVRVEATSRIEVTGSGNTVAWERGPSKGKKPKVSNVGMNNAISQAR